MVQTLMAEVRQADTDEASRHLLARIHRETVEELSAILSPDLMDELSEFTACCDDEGIPTEAEIRVAQAQLVGWMQGLLGTPGIDGPTAGGSRPTTPAPPAGTPAAGCAAGTPRFTAAGSDGHLSLSRAATR